MPHTLRIKFFDVIVIWKGKINLDKFIYKKKKYYIGANEWMSECLTTPQLEI